jgi:hypothetical protein
MVLCSLRLKKPRALKRGVSAFHSNKSSSANVFAGCCLHDIPLAEDTIPCPV